ncbi:MAG: ribosome recycling factor [Pseudomonadota bacterium]
MLNLVYDEIKDKMEFSLTHFGQSLTKLRTGKASAALLDGISVDYYGARTPLKNMANISTPEPKLIIIQPWDLTALASIEKAILKSELGLNPSSDGKIIRIAIPNLTEERRKELSKLVNKMGEECKVSLRQHRRDSNDSLKKMENDKDITEDENHKGQDQVQKILGEYIKKVDEITTKKQAEIMEV